MKGKFRTLLLLLLLLPFSSLDSVDHESHSPLKAMHEEEEGYTINFNNVSILEYIKFISQIAQVNFTYQEADLNFNVTIISDEPTRLTNVMAALVQILKINGLDLIEQDNNLLIARAGTTRQIATVVSPELPLKEGKTPPIMTRVFKIKNANPERTADMVKPFLSIGAILEVSQETRHIIITDISQNIAEIEKLLVSIDAPKSGLEIDSYAVQNNNPESLATLASQIITPISEGNPLIIVPQERTHSIFVVSTPFLIEKTLAVLADLDSTPSLAHKLTASNILLYHIQYKTPDTIQASISQIMQNLSQMGSSANQIVDALKSMKYIRGSTALLFTGDPSALSEVNSLLKNIDVPYTSQELEYVEGGYLVYKIKYGDEEQIARSLEKFVNNLQSSDSPDTELIKTIDSMKWIKENDSLIFTGDQTSIEKLKQLLPKFDIPVQQGRTAGRLPISNEFFAYKPKNLLGEDLYKQIQATYKSLKESQLSDPSLLHSLQTAKWLPASETLVFTGTSESLERVHSLIKLFDELPESSAETPALFIYQIKNIDPQVVEQGFQKIVKSLPPESSLTRIIETGRYMHETRTYVFYGPGATIDRLKEILANLDQGNLDQISNTFYIFKPSYQTPSFIIEQADHTASEMQGSKLANVGLIKALKSGSEVSNGTAVLFTGSPQAIEALKEVVPTLDIPHDTPRASTEFFIFRPMNSTAQEVKDQSQNIASDMKNTQFADPTLIHTLENGKLISGGQALLYTGTKESVDKVKEILPALDVNVDAERRGEKSDTIFKVYKIKHASGLYLIEHLQHLATDLDNSGSAEKGLIQTLNTARYIKENNSIVFVGSPQAVNQADALAAKFDIPGGKEKDIEPRKHTSGYLIYKPQHLPGEELIQVLEEFETNLTASGIKEPDLFDVINHLKWMKSTSTIIISGNHKEAEKVLALLERFDTPKEGEKGKDALYASSNDISFLIYKLQYHSGQEIQEAVKQVGTDLAKTKSKGNEALAEAISALQYIEITNSLISTGQPAALAKLRELIKSIDIPLKQVFVEVLVVETTMSNALNFGLRWGSQGKYNNKFSYGTGSFPAETSGSGPTDPLGVFQQNLQNITAKNTPTGKYIPFASGFDLGVIGDIILHKGATYFALGSLVNALRTESESTIVLNQKLITQDNKNSTLFIGQNVPYTGSTVTNTSSHITKSANIEYRDIGVNLSITPTIGQGDLITLAIDQNISEQVNTGNSSVSSNTVSGITTNKTSTQTVVSVPDQSFLVLSGQIRNTTAKNRTGIPCLGGLPVIGAAFSEKETNKNTSNLIIFIRPHMIKSFDTYKEITENQEAIYKSQANAEEFDAGLELVKTPDDQ